MTTAERLLAWAQESKRQCEAVIAMYDGPARNHRRADPRQVDIARIRLQCAEEFIAIARGNEPVTNG